MFTLKEIVIFLAGAQAFHTFSHLMLPVMLAMPLQLKWPHMVFTARWNGVVIAANAVITLLLVAWALRL